MSATEVSAATSLGNQSQNAQDMLIILNEKLQQTEVCYNENIGMVNNPMPFTESKNRLNTRIHLHAKSLAFSP